MIQEIVDIIERIKEKIADGSDMVWTSYNSAEELRNELNIYAERLTNGDKICLDKLNIHFLPTGTFQEHAMMNYWTEEYMKLSTEWDKLYEAQKNE